MAAEKKKLLLEKINFKRNENPEKKKKKDMV